MELDMEIKQGKYYLIFLVVLLVFFAISNLLGMRYFGSQSEKWSPESQGQSHK
jgi:hypothetical protein